jgi:Glycosyl transferases group 1
MSPIKRIAIFSIPDHHYISVTMGLKRGLEQLGVEAFVSWPPLSGPNLACFVDNYKPDIVLEIDRFRDQIPNFDEPVRHVAWVFNHIVHGRRVTENATGSSAVYMVTDPMVTGFEHLDPGSYGYLMPACDPTTFYPRRLDPFFDFTMIGHLYGPLRADTLDTVIQVDGQPIGRIGDLVDEFMASDIQHWKQDNRQVDDFIIEFFAQRGYGINRKGIPGNIRYVIDEYMIRLKDRKRVADGLLAVSRDVGFFGNPEWAEWPEFNPYYYGTLNRPNSLADTICRTRVNIHNGPVTMHMRVMEVMGCGMPLLVNRSLWDSKPCGIESHFTPYEHYIPYDLDAIEEVAAKALRDEAWRVKIAEAGHRHVLAHHTWRHRAEYLLRDLAERW